MLLRELGEIAAGGFDTVTLGGSTRVLKAGGVDVNTDSNYFKGGQAAGAIAGPGGLTAALAKQAAKQVAKRGGSRLARAGAGAGSAAASGVSSCVARGAVTGQGCSPKEAATEAVAAAIGGGLLGGLARCSVPAAKAGASALEEASEAAFKASRGPISISPKHYPGAGGGYSKFGQGVDIDATVREALQSPGAIFRPNRNAAGDIIPGYRVYTDLGRTVGTRGQTGVRTIVSPDGRVITSFPGRPWR